MPGKTQKQRWNEFANLETATEIGLAKGREIGLAKGREIGLAKGRMAVLKTVVKKTLALNMLTVSQISKIFSMDENEVRAIEASEEPE